MVPYYTILAILPVCSATAACLGPEVNQPALNLVQQFEDFRATIYKDPAGHPAVGYGHLCSDSACSDVPYTIPLSYTDAERLLRDDLADCITNDTGNNVVLNANQYGALVSWAFNVGCENSGFSALIERLNMGEDPTSVATDELPRWNMIGDEVVPAFERRRAAEVDLFLAPSGEDALPALC
ncbi:Lysozyme-like protein [Hapsidospora chrysogenum ATCC 11550]|uniref:Lysozyme-like protein n=1 Tax=Hapsidospora chrysogenum (strain ATCC 11550 / CBS 779.69 / DSM 880 / IAM 14645 / JCM 23072 / IMI 49137) TaxID=857340 RepID=A0A086T9F0_HAPC1|nr:Lysozyme-like protein [Hapsidospora chrysogenum ATCC 11550]